MVTFYDLWFENFEGDLIKSKVHQFLPSFSKITSWTIIIKLSDPYLLSGTKQSRTTEEKEKKTEQWTKHSTKYGVKSNQNLQQKIEVLPKSGRSVFSVFFNVNCFTFAGLEIIFFRGHFYSKGAFITYLTSPCIWYIRTYNVYEWAQRITKIYLKEEFRCTFTIQVKPFIKRETSMVPVLCNKNMD